MGYHAFTSSTGGSDRMMLLVRSDRFEVLREGIRELTSSGGPDSITFPSGNARRPFFIELRDSANSGLEFIFMVNHFTRGDAQNRRRQAEGLREWVRAQSIAIIAAGDFDFRNLTCNHSMAIFLRRPASDGGALVWQWVIPPSEFTAWECPMLTGASDF